MKNTTSHDPSYSLLPALRVAFKSEEVVKEEEVKTSTPAGSKKLNERTKVQPSKKTPPLFDDYRIKAKDHDPL